ncbi:MAG: DUF2970 domain-containing protein [Gammaproteobacteria bacterium]
MGDIARGRRINSHTVDPMSSPENPQSRPGAFQILKAVLASAIGVQSRKNFERDMKTRSPWPYIVGGLIGTALFIFTVVTVVRMVLHGAGG